MGSRKNPSRLAPALAVVGASLLFGTTGTAQALGPRTATALGVGAIRLVVGAAALAAIAVATGSRAGHLWRKNLRPIVVGAIAVVGYHLLWFAGLRRTGVALGTIVGIGSGPVFAGLIHLLVRRAPLARSWMAGTALTIAGATLLGSGGGGGMSADPVGLACVIGSGLGYAIYAEGAKRAIEGGLDPRAAMAGVFVLAAVLALPVLAAQPLRWIVTPGGIALAIHLGLVTLAVGYTLYGWGLERLAVPTVVTLTLAEPLTASLLGVAVLGERLGATGWLGVGLISVGLTLAARGGAEPEREALPLTP